MTLAKYITGFIAGGALGCFICGQFIAGDTLLAILGIAILALYLSLKLEAGSTKVIVKPREYIEKEAPPLPLPQPKALYERKSGIIEDATIEMSKFTENPYIQLVIRTRSFSFADRKVDKVFKQISSLHTPSYENLKEATGVAPEVNLDKDGTEVTDKTLHNLVGIPILFELWEQEYAGTMRLKVGALYKAPKNKRRW